MRCNSSSNSGVTRGSCRVEGDRFELISIKVSPGLVRDVSHGICGEVATHRRDDRIPMRGWASGREPRNDLIKRKRQANAKNQIMTRREAGIGLLSTAAAAVMPAVSALAAQPVVLPAPRSQGGKPLIEALLLRRSIREYSEQPLPPQVLSDLLWAAFGINRPSGDRTAPYWRHIMAIDVYAAMADGVWLYDPKQHKLLPHLELGHSRPDRAAGFRRARSAQPRVCGTR